MANLSHLTLETTAGHSGTWRSSTTGTDRVGVVAHRGIHHSVAENSREAFREVTSAVHAGVPLGVEFDIRPTADGVLVINHDPDFRGVDLSCCTLAQLNRWFGYQAPITLEEAVDILSSAPLPVIDAELKEPGHTAAALAILSVIPDDQLLVSSFVPSVVSEVRQLAPHLRTGLLLDLPDGTFRRHRHFIKLLKETGADTLIPEESQLSPMLAEQVRFLGKELGTYTVNEPETLMRMNAGLEVSWVATDNPEVLHPELLELETGLVVA